MNATIFVLKTKVVIDLSLEPYMRSREIMIEGGRGGGGKATIFAMHAILD